MNADRAQQSVECEATARPSSRSLRGLDALNFLMADVRDGLGPFLSVYLKGTEHWSSGNIGLVMAASGIAAAICQIPAGLIVDAVRVKRLLIAISGLLVAAGCILIAFFRSCPPCSPRRSRLAQRPPLFLPALPR